MKRHTFSHPTTAFAVFVSLILTAITGADETWPQWRGPSRDCQLSAGDAWPDNLSDTSLKKIWQVELGESYSGPIVVGDRVFTTESKNKQEFVYAFDRNSGEKLWERSWDGSMKVPFFASSNGSWIRSTPAYSDGKLYVGGMRDVLVAIDGETGNVVWKFDFMKQTGSKLPSFGFVCSPLVVGDHVYVQAGGGVAKLNKNDGSLVWLGASDGGGMYGSAFSSPIAGTLHGQDVIWVQSREELKALDPESGNEICSREIEAFRGMNILTPTAVGDRIFTSAHSGEAQLISFPGGAASEVQWADKKLQAYMSSPVVIDGHIYMHLKNQRFACIEAATGQQKWRTKGYGKYWSMVVNGDRILALDERGDLLLIRANPAEFELLDERHLGESPTWGHLAVVGNRIYVRELKSLSVYEWN